MDRDRSQDVDRFYRALADSRRRIAIRILNEQASLDVDALTESIATREDGPSDRERIEISLVHQHLPLLAEAGIVSYDRDEEQVTMRESVEPLLPLASPLAQ